MDEKIKQLSARVARLEQELQALQDAIGQRKPPKAWWQQLAGEFQNDPSFLEIARLGRKIRKSERKP